MYAIHFVLFVETLVLSHIMQLCLKSYIGNQTSEESAKPSNESHSTEEEEIDNCPFAPWSGWSECTVTCGDGFSVRHRIVLILENCTGDMVQERICSQRSCPHDREFIFRRKEEEDSSQSSRANENEQAVEDDPNVQQEDIKPENNPDHSEKHVTDYSNEPPESFESDNVNPNRDGETQEEESHGRARGHSWTSDDGNPWGHQSSFDSHGEGNDNCFSDCSPTDPPADRFGSPRNSYAGSEHGEPKSTQGGEESFSEDKKNEESAKSEEKDSHEKENDDTFKEKQKLNDKKLKHDDEISNDDDDQFDAETDFEDENDFDDENDDYDDNEADQDENGRGKGSGRRRKQDHNEEEEGEQDDLEQDEDVEGKNKRSRRKKKRRRKRKRKKCEEAEEQTKRNSQVVCDPTEICDTFMTAVENFTFGNAETVMTNENPNEGCSERTSVVEITNANDQNNAEA